MMEWRRFPGRAVLAAGVLSWACGGDGGGGSLRPLVEGDEAPAYEAELLSGEVLDVGATGGPVLLNVWATWCVPCREEMPALQMLHEELGPQGLTVVAVSIDGAGGAADIRRFLNDYGITFPIVHDAAERVTRVFRTTGVPETFLIVDGRVAKRWRGPVTKAGAEAAVRAHL